MKAVEYTKNVYNTLETASVRNELNEEVLTNEIRNLTTACFLLACRVRLAPRNQSDKDVIWASDMVQRNADIITKNIGKTTY